MVDLTKLNARRKPDREKIAAVLIDAAESFGADVERHDGERNPGYHGQSIDLSISLNGVGALIDIDDLHGGERALIHWHNTEYPARDFAAGFNAAIADYNYRPHHKATSNGGWSTLAELLKAGLRLARDGNAFRANQKEEV